jgi:hypothetical protein
VYWWLQLIANGSLNPVEGGDLIWYEGWDKLGHPTALRWIIGLIPPLSGTGGLVEPEGEKGQVVGVQHAATGAGEWCVQRRGPAVGDGVESVDRAGEAAGDGGDGVGVAAEVDGGAEGGVEGGGGA